MRKSPTKSPSENFSTKCCDNKAVASEKLLLRSGYDKILKIERFEVGNILEPFCFEFSDGETCH